MRKCITSYGGHLQVEHRWAKACLGLPQAGDVGTVGPNLRGALGTLGGQVTGCRLAFTHLVGEQLSLQTLEHQPAITK